MSRVSSVVRCHVGATAEDWEEIASVLRETEAKIRAIARSASDITAMEAAAVVSDLAKIADDYADK